MYRLDFEPTFKADYQKFKRQYPFLMDEFLSLLEELRHKGTVPNTYKPHILNNRGGNYNGFTEFHLSDGKIDIIVIEKAHQSNPIIRLVRMGTHDELFRGKQK